MESLPTLVNEFKLSATTNAVCVAMCKFTLDQMQSAFGDGIPAPERLARQLKSFGEAYDTLNAAYAPQQKRKETAEIASLDQEGDQLIAAFKGLVSATLRMGFDAKRVAAAQSLSETWAKYRIDASENLISEWSKVQQVTEEMANDGALKSDAQMLGLDALLERLAKIADEIRRLMTERNASQPVVGAMKQAREAVHAEYRTLIVLLNAYAITDDEPQRFAKLIAALNDNIDYTRRHAVSRAAKPNFDVENDYSDFYDEGDITELPDEAANPDGTDADTGGNG